MRWRTLAPIPLVLLTVALALLQCGGWDGTMNGDGVSYLDLAAQYARGDLSALANGYWSPLYPMLIGGALRLAGIGGPTADAQLLTPELRVVFAVNVVVMAMAALAFVRLLHALHRASPASSRAVTACRAIAASALFVWCAIRFIGTTSVTPDALLTTWLLLLTAELVAAASGAPSRSRTVRVAVLLAAGYWTKAVFFPVALVVLPIYLLLALRDTTLRADRRAHLVRALVPALALVAPLVLVQSVTQQRLSFGETGRLNYRWYVLGAPHAPPSLAPERVAMSAAPVTLALDTAPGTLLFRGDVAGSFPYWYDPSRFEPRAPLAFSARAQWTQIAYNAHWYRVVTTPFAVLVLVAFAASLARSRARLGTSMLVVALPALALTTLYALTHVEGRLAVPPMLVLFVLMLYPLSARTRIGVEPEHADTHAATWRRACTVVQCTALIALTVLAVGRTAKRVPTSAIAAPAARRAGPAAELRASGVTAGSSLGIVGSPYGHYWAHEARLRLAAVTTTDGRRTPVGDAELDAIAGESCARGAPLAAIVGARAADVQSARAMQLTSGWWLWRPATPCPAARTL